MTPEEQGSECRWGGLIRLAHPCISCAACPTANLAFLHGHVFLGALLPFPHSHIAEDSLTIHFSGRAGLIYQSLRQWQWAFFQTIFLGAQ